MDIQVYEYTKLSSMRFPFWKETGIWVYRYTELSMSISESRLVYGYTGIQTFLIRDFHFNILRYWYTGILSDSG